MLASVVFAATVVMMTLTSGGVVVSSTQAVAVTAEVPVRCPFLFEERAGKCVHRKEVEEAVAASRHKRQAVPKQECPKCVAGIFEVYPKWDDCSKLHYCFNGHNILLDCRQFNATFFNPVSKACEISARPDNICLYRASTVLLA
ncbi:uncharacterized protein LOC143295236 [Babylonia areolata]|uniref:uncharacterized protein LOC143295236 n=1 Tax=Babylonia areolata TaxID=304850 RepID=UPI003FD51521